VTDMRLRGDTGKTETSGAREVHERASQPKQTQTRLIQNPGVRELLSLRTYWASSGAAPRTRSTLAPWERAEGRIGDWLPGTCCPTQCGSDPGLHRGQQRACRKRRVARESDCIAIRPRPSPQLQHTCTDTQTQNHKVDNPHELRPTPISTCKGDISSGANDHKTCDKTRATTVR
jgi:hypothetical protein